MHRLLTAVLLLAVLVMTAQLTRIRRDVAEAQADLRRMETRAVTRKVLTLDNCATDSECEAVGAYIEAAAAMRLRTQRIDPNVGRP